MVGATVILAEVSSAGSSPLPSLGAIVSVLASVATITSVVILSRQARGEQRVRDADQQHKEDVQRQQDDQLRLDFYGDNRPGVPARRGVLVWMEDISRQMEQVIAEITPNHGGSIKDSVGRIENRVTTIESDLRGLHGRLDKQGH